MVARLVVALGMVLLVAAPASAEPPTNTQRRVGIGAGLAFPEVFHLDVSVHLHRTVSVEARAFFVPGFGFGDGQGGLEAGITGHFGGRHAFLVNARGAAYRWNDETQIDPLFGIGYRYRGTSADFRALAGILITEESDWNMGEQTYKTIVWPAISLTWYVYP